MSRHGRARVRAQLLFLEACEEIEDRVDQAKAAHAEALTPETLQAKREAMQQLHETRRWIRAVDGIKRAERDLADYGGRTDEKSRRKVAAAEKSLKRIPREHGELIAAMEALSGTTVNGQPPADPVPDGSVRVSPKPVRARAGVRRPGGGA